jgi:hypothetical protein
LYDWKRAFWACFRENWVYKFGHWVQSQHSPPHNVIWEAADEAVLNKVHINPGQMDVKEKFRGNVWRIRMLSIWGKKSTMHCIKFMK